MVTRFNAVYRRLLERRLAAEALIRQQDVVAVFTYCGMTAIGIQRVALTERIKEYEKASAAVLEIE